MNYVLWKRKLFLIFNRTLVPIEALAKCVSADGTVDTKVLQSVLININDKANGCIDVATVNPLELVSVAANSNMGTLVLENSIEVLTSIECAFNLVLSEFQLDITSNMAQSMQAKPINKVESGANVRCRIYVKNRNYVEITELMPSLNYSLNMNVLTSKPINIASEMQNSSSAVALQSLTSIPIIINIKENDLDNVVTVNAYASAAVLINDKADSINVDELISIVSSNALKPNAIGDALNNSLTFGMLAKSKLSEHKLYTLGELSSKTLYELDYHVLY